MERSEGIMQKAQIPVGALHCGGRCQNLAFSSSDKSTGSHSGRYLSLGHPAACLPTSVCCLPGNCKADFCCCTR